MTNEQYRRALKKLDLSIVGAGPILGMTGRQSQRLAATTPIPQLVAKVLRLLLAGKITVDDLRS